MSEEQLEVTTSSGFGETGAATFAPSQLSESITAGGVVSDTSTVNADTSTVNANTATLEQQLKTDEYIQKQIQLGLHKYLSQMAVSGFAVQDSACASEDTEVCVSPVVSASAGPRHPKAIEAQTKQSVSGFPVELIAVNREAKFSEQPQEVRYQGRSHTRSRISVSAAINSQFLSESNNGGLTPLPALNVPANPRSSQDAAMMERLNNRREASSISYKDMYSSDRRKPNTQLPEAATFSEARASFMGSTIPTTGLAVGLDTRELWMMSSLRAPGINGLI
jgi:hypothetical protein